jgi:HAD superfamily hydrolase (TIGR01509 family)
MTVNKKTVIFDRDGVIINSEALTIDAMRKAFKKLGFNMPDSDIPHVIGQSSTKYTEYFLTKWEFNPDKFREIMKEFYYKRLDKSLLFPQTITLIKNLYKENVTMGVTTSAGFDGTLQILKMAGIEKMFKVIVTREDCEKHKPDPEPYILTAKKLGNDPSLCIAIEDTSLGIESAKNAGMVCVAFPNSFTKDQDFTMADYIVSSNKELESILKNILPLAYE